MLAEMEPSRPIAIIIPLGSLFGSSKPFIESGVQIPRITQDCACRLSNIRRMTPMRGRGRGNWIAFCGALRSVSTELSWGRVGFLGCGNARKRLSFAAQSAP